MYTTIWVLIVTVFWQLVHCRLAGAPQTQPQSALAEFRQCEPIRIDMCRGIGYNETSMPNVVGHELQTDVEYTLQTFAPLIEYVCSTQLKLFLCAAYVPMCTPKVPVHAIGPCRSLCESVRVRCHPVLQGFGFPWPPALDCARFPKENNHETMCMEGPGEAAHSPIQEHEQLYGGVGMPPMGGIGSKLPPNQSSMRDCPGLAKSNLYRKLQRSGRCAPLCDADVIFSAKDKYLTELWVSTWAYAALAVALLALLCLLLSDDRLPRSSKWSRVLTPLVWCHSLVTIGWIIRFISGRTATACGIDPQLPNESLLLVDGLSNARCAAVFLLRYYFGMAACAWWAILCLGWHREIRRYSPDANGHITLPAGSYVAGNGQVAKRQFRRPKNETNITHNNFVCFVAWGLPAFQTAAVIVARFVDADELLGACFVGNQYDKGLQVLVATPIFCYWIFGSMNLISGYLVHRRNKEIMRTTNSLALQQQMKLCGTNSGGIGTFLFIYGWACACLLFAVIYEFVNIDVWLSTIPTDFMESIAPLWPFLTRAFMELMLGIICFAWVLGPNLSQIYRRQISPRRKKQQPNTMTPTITLEQQQQHHNQQHNQQLHHNHHHQGLSTGSGRASDRACSTIVSYHTMRPHASHKHPTSMSSSGAGAISLNQMSNYSLGRSTQNGTSDGTLGATSSLHLYMNNHNNFNSHNHHHHPQQQQHHHHHHKKHMQQQTTHHAQYNRYGNETLL